MMEILALNEYLDIKKKDVENYEKLYLVKNCKIQISFGGNPYFKNN